MSVWKNRLLKVQRIAGVGSFERDLVTGKGYWSDQTFRIMGLEPGEIEPDFDLFVERILHPEDRESFLNAVSKARHDGEIFDIGVRLITGKGEVRHVRCLAEVEYGPGDKPLRITGVMHDITERKRAEEALRKSEALLAEVGRLAKIGGWEHDLRTRKAVWTRETYRIVEIPEDREPPGPDEHVAFYHPEDQPILSEAMRRSIETGEPFDVELRCNTAAGRPIWGRVIGSPIFEGGECVKMTGTFQDITERKKGEEAQRESEALLRHVGSMAKIGGWEFDPKTMEVHWTDETCNIHEVPVGKIPTLDEALTFYHPEDRPKLLAAIQKALDHGEPYDLEIRFITAKGRPLWTRTMGGPQYEDGKIVKLTGTFQDITDRKKTEEALRESEAKFRGMFENVRDAVFLHEITEDGLPGTFLDFNEAVRKRLGYSREELLRMDPMTLDVPEVVQEVVPRVMAELKVKGHALFESVQMAKDGRRIPVENHTRVIELGGRRMMITVCRDITERKRAEEALRESEERFRAVFEQAAWAIYVHDHQGRIIDVNRRGCDQLGYSRDELLDMSVTDVDPDVKSRNDIAKYWSAIEQGPVIFEARNRRKDGSFFAVEVALGQIIYGGRSVILSLVQDITERNRAAEALARSEAKWRHVLKNTPQIGISLDPQARIIFANEHFLELTGWKEEEVIGKNWFDTFIPPEIRKEVREVFRTVMAQKHTLGYSTYHNEIVLKNGERRIIDWSNALTLDAEGRPLDVTCLGVDLTERLCDEEALRRSEELLKLSQSVSKVGGWYRDLVTGGTYWTDEHYRVMGYEPGEVEPSPELFMDRVVQEDRGAIEEMRLLALAGMDEYSVEYRLERKDGKMRHMRTTGRVLRDADNVPRTMFGSIQDITEQKNIEQALMHALSEKEAMLLEIHHRVKNNLQVILSLLDLTRFRTKSKEAGDVVMEVHAKINSMALIHNELYRQENFESIDIPGFAGLLENQLAYLYGRREIDFQVEGRDVRLGLDKAIPVGLVLNELFTNALKYAFPDGGGRLVCKVEKRDGMISIGVSDNGVGLPRDFDPKNAGTLGFKLIHDLVTVQLKGELEIDIRGGTTVKFAFPA